LFFILNLPERIVSDHQPIKRKKRKKVKRESFWRFKFKFKNGTKKIGKSKIKE
jgi:hypothetical protein